MHTIGIQIFISEEVSLECTLGWFNFDTNNKTLMSFDAQHNENALIPYTDSKVQIRLSINTAQSGQYIRFMITKNSILTEVHRLKWYFKTKC